MKPSEFLRLLEKAQLLDPGQERVAQARDILFALPADERERLAGMCCRLRRSLPNAGAVTTFEVFVAVARCAAKQEQ
jgi:hypothetical protein